MATKQHPVVPVTALELGLTSYRDRMKVNFDQHHWAKILTNLSLGDEVWMRDREEPGVVTGKGGHPRSFIIATQDGAYQCNKVQLNKFIDNEAGQPVTVQHCRFQVHPSNSCSSTTTACKNMYTIHTQDHHKSWPGS